MVLKGSLREFILADIFNLLAQQKITGKLILSTGDEEGILAFKEGLVAGAVKGDEQIRRKLFNVLVTVCNYPGDEIRGLFQSFENNMDGLFNEILHQNLLSKEVLESFAVSVVEDIACGFFLWTKGTYYFSSVPYVDDIAPSCVSISVENMAMEAMRRVDEWNRMKKSITNEVVFVTSERRPPELSDAIDPLTQPEEYVYSRIDGISPVSALFRTTCLTEYKVYEALQSLINSGRITPLSTRISQSVVAALEKKEMETQKEIRPLTTIAALGITLVMALVIAFMGSSLLRGVILLDLEIDRQLARLEVPLGGTIQKVAIATLHYHGLKGTPTSSVQELTRKGLLMESDIKPLFTMRSIKELPRAKKNYILYPGLKR
ncbi:MAG: DUF4388 domain-containing protein [Chitinispirillaceae bacterium]|nr:DUF4388 domain-containing protein [Chitinispirillaceae bacterium]